MVGVYFQVSLPPPDIHLILNLVDASTSFRSAESWTPICLPKFNDTGFLHAHVSYLPKNSPACLLLISTDKEKFFDLQECQQRIVEVSRCAYTSVQWSPCINPLPTIGNSLKKQKSLYKVLTPSIKPSI